MQRKGHLFVNDYGMQVNILSRYGIKNFAVPGKDYVFINGDCHDFRYSNIHIINRYYGVSQVKKINVTLYKTKIHVVGDHVIGVYHTEELAAIAYNKACDLANSHGIEKKYTLNYIETLSPREYAEQYTNIKISEKFLLYLKMLP